MGQRIDAIGMAKRLVSFDTTSRESNLELIGFVAEYLEGHGVSSTLIRSDDRRKANLYATIGPHDRGGVVLSGHTDVVPVDGQDWSTPPFAPVERDGRLFGRGTADMKSFIAVALALVPDMAERRLKTPIHLALSYDEEVGCLGVHGMISHIRTAAPMPSVVIVGEPTEMKVVNAHKGVFSFKTTVRGLEAHSSATHIGVNAVYYAAELIGHLARLSEEWQEKASAESRFEPPYTTIHVGVVKGGTALNIVPRECSFVWEFRLVPGEDEREILDRFNAFAENEVLPRMRARWDGASVATERRNTIRPLLPQDGSPAETLAMMLAGTNSTHAVSYGTEGGFFQAADLPTVICGPGNILQAHKPDEFIEVEQIRACERFVHRLIDYAAR